MRRRRMRDSPPRRIEFEKKTKNKHYTTGYGKGYDASVTGVVTALIRPLKRLSVIHSQSDFVFITILFDAMAAVWFISRSVV